MLVAYASVSLRIWPDYLAFFNEFAGGRDNGYRRLVDSSLDWGQDLPELKQWLDRNRGTETVYLSYFGSADPAYYRIDAKVLPGFLPRPPGAMFDLGGGIYAISATMLQITPKPELADWTPDNERELRKYAAEVARLREAQKHPDTLRAFLKNYPPDYWAKTVRTWDLYRFGKLASRLRTRRPDANIGGSILIFRLTDAEINRLMNGKRK